MLYLLRPNFALACGLFDPIFGGFFRTLDLGASYVDNAHKE